MLPIHMILEAIRPGLISVVERDTMTTPAMSSLETRGDSATASKKVSFTLWAKGPHGEETIFDSYDSREKALDFLDAFVAATPEGKYAAAGVTRVTETVEFVALETHTFDSKD